MTEKILIDSSVLVCAYDYSEPMKQETAFTLLDQLVTANNGLISTQILSEFFVVATLKIPDPLTYPEAEKRVANFCQIWPVIHINEMITIEAIRGVGVHQFSFWDALIWATARLSQAYVVFSRNFPHNQIVEGVRFFNPFSLQ